MLSNTATPIYYGQFRDAVLRGEIPVCKQIGQEMDRIDGLIANPNYYYDPDAINGWIRFCENELTLTDGTNVKLLDTFKLWGEQVFGWYHFVERPVFQTGPDGHGGHFVNKRIKRRLINKQFLIVGRGAAKSMYSSFIQAFYLTVNRATTHQVTIAPTMPQAEEVMQPLRTAITRSRGPYFKLLTMGSINNTTGNRANRVKLVCTKKGIEDFITGSLLEVKPWSIDKLQGQRIKIATVDEWLSGVTREDPIGALEQSAAKGNMPDYLIIATSSEGTVRNGPGDNIKMELEKILDGEYKNDHVSIWWYRLDSLDEIGHYDKTTGKYVYTPFFWQKANPNLGQTVDYEVYQDEVLRAEKVPAARNDILAKRFGIPMEGYTFFFTYEETLRSSVHRDYWGMPCSMGADLSRGDDFCSFSFLFPLRDGSFGITTRNYISEVTLMKLEPAARIKYDEFMNEGSLMVMPGAILDLMDVYSDLSKYIDDSEYTVICFGFDPWNAKEFVEKWSMENGSYGIVKVIQGAKTESVPLGQLKTLAEQKLLLFDQSILQFAMGNCMVKEDNNGMRTLGKKRGQDKIDPFAATLDAFVAYKEYAEDFDSDTA